MKAFLSLAALTAGASAATLRLQPRATDSCCFGINVNGGHQGGSLGQLDDGQNRVGPGFGGASYCLSGDTITDSAGRACVIAMPQTQFQCDLNGTPTPGFSVTSGGLIAYQGNTTFYECAATANMQFNLYTTPSESYCAAVTLSVTGTTGACSSSSSTCSAVTSTTTQVSVSTVTATVVQTAPAVTVTVTGAGSTGTVTVTETETAVATVTVTGPGSTGTVTAAPGTITEYVTVTGAGQTVVQTETAEETVVQTMTAQETIATTVVETAPGTTIVQTAPGTTVIETAPGTTVVQTAPGTTVVETAPGTTVVKTAPGTTVVETAPGTTVVQTAPGTTATETVSATVSTTAVVTPTPYTSTSTTSTTPAPSSTSSSCPPNISGSYQYPHLIIPVSSTSPNTAYGTQYNGTVSPSVSTIFNFDIPSSYAGETCSLIFLLPYADQLETSAYELSGNGGIEVLQLSSPATSGTTYNNAPSVEANLGTFDVQPGSSTVIVTTKCAAGQTVAYELKATGSYDLEFFEDYNPSPLGLYVRAC